MEKFQMHRENAAKKIKSAEHSLRFTYPVVRDTRLLLGINENLLLSLQEMVFAIVSYERLFRRVPPYLEDFDSQYKIFREKVAPRYQIDEKFFRLIERVAEISKKHKASPMEFAKDDRFVICSDRYKIDSVNARELENLIYDANEFFRLINSIVAKNEYLFT